MKGKIKPGAKLYFQGSLLVGYFIKRNAERAVIELSSQQILDDYLKNYGRMPLPPYIHRKQGDSPIIQQQDKIRYQTVFASQSGAIAAPTAGLHFTKTHLKKLKGNNIEMAYLTLPDVGTAVEMGKAMGTMEAAKMTGELYAPVSGVVVKKNDAVLKNPLLVNEEPYDNGWLVKIEPTNWEDDSAGMVTGNDLSTWVDAEIERFETQGILG